MRRCAATGLRLTYVKLEYRDVCAVSCRTGESRVTSVLETGMRRVAVCGVGGVR